MKFFNFFNKHIKSPIIAFTVFFYKFSTKLKTVFFSGYTLRCSKKIKNRAKPAIFYCLQLCGHFMVINQKNRVYPSNKNKSRFCYNFSIASFVYDSANWGIATIGCVFAVGCGIYCYRSDLYSFYSKLVVSPSLYSEN